MTGHLKEGQGWRLGWNPNASIFKALVGGSDWAVELTGPEFDDFQRLTHQLVATMQKMTTELMDDERLSCEQETELIWMEVEGYPHSYTLRFILLSGRQVEGGWPADVTAGLVQALPGLQVF